MALDPTGVPSLFLSFQKCTQQDMSSPGTEHAEIQELWGLTEHSTSKTSGEVALLPACSESYPLPRGVLTGAPDSPSSQAVGFLGTLKMKFHDGKGHLDDRIAF